jgi:hypothetical protein
MAGDDKSATNAPLASRSRWGIVVYCLGYEPPLAIQPPHTANRHDADCRNAGARRFLGENVSPQRCADRRNQVGPTLGAAVRLNVQNGLFVQSPLPRGLACRPGSEVEGCMRFRKLRIAWAVGWGIACVLLIVLWVRSFWTRDRLAGQLTHARAFHVDSFVGRVAISWRVRPQDLPPVPTEFSTHDDPEGFWNPNENILGFHIEGDPGTTVVSMPFWFLVFLTSSLCYISWLLWQFSRRTLLIGMTLVAVVLGLIVYTSR